CNHIFNVLESVIARQFMFGKSLQEKLQRGNWSFQLVCKTIDKIMLQSIKLQCLLIIDKNGKYSQQDYSHKN
ncbi:MAG TPA: hypothetical protein VMW95_00305, partial [Desulfobacterales bacterium]|nr:hypothetical protein [Desulfobacterales bacterium]